MDITIAASMFSKVLLTVSRGARAGAKEEVPWGLLC